MDFNKSDFHYGNFKGGIHTNFRFEKEFLKNKKAKKHFKKLLDIAEKEIDKETKRIYKNARRRAKETIEHFRSVVND